MEPSLGGGLKLLPTAYDTDAFEAVVHGRDKSNLKNHKICQAYIHFQNKINDYIGTNHSVDDDGFQHSYKRLLNLFTSLTNNFTVVQIEAPDEESQKIFETLNATGRQLSEFDYLRNNLFLRIGTELTHADARNERSRLYNTYWSQFEVSYNEWEDKIFEEFLWIFLEAKLGSQVFQEKKEKYSNIKAFNLYRDYSEGLQSDQGPEYEIQQLGDYGSNYRKMISHGDEIGNRMQFYEDLEITELRPLILYALSELGLSVPETDMFFDTLESYIVQSRLIGLSAKKIYETIQDCFNQVLDENTPFVENFHQTLQLPNSTKIQRAWNNVGNKNQKLIRYILYRIECLKREKVQNPDVELVTLDFSALESLEHVMPRNWQFSWPLSSNGENLYFRDLYEDDYIENNPNWYRAPSADRLKQKNKEYRDAHKEALRRIDAVQSIGNLTPLAKNINVDLANYSFQQKKDFLSKAGRANLVLTHELIHNYNKWETDDIEHRTLSLFEDFREIWPIEE